MVDLQANEQRKYKNVSEGKVKIFIDSRTPRFIDRTPSFLKSKFLSLAAKLDISANLSSSADSQSNDSVSNKNSDEVVSLDENIIDFESRKAREKRAQEELSTGKYRHPNFIARKKPSNLNNFLSDSPISVVKITSSTIKTPTSTDTLADDSPKDDMFEMNPSNASEIYDDPVADTNSENDFNRFSEASIDLRPLCYSNSDLSIQSLKSIASLESQFQDDTLEFMRRFIDTLFQNSSHLTLELKSEFGQKSRTEVGRYLFARLVCAKRACSKRVSENTFYSLIQHFAIVLFECNENDDFSPAKILMNMCFTFYLEVEVPGCEPYREYLYMYLRHQPIWQAIRFWNAAYFDAIQSERKQRAVPPTLSTKIASDSSEEDDLSSGTKSIQKHLMLPTNLEMIKDDQEFQRNICFGLLGTFTCNMHAFGLSKEICNEFLRKQCIISSITNDQEKMLHDNITRIYKETAKWRAN